MKNERENYEEHFVTIERERAGICHNRCALCGQWILPDDPYYIVIFNSKDRSLIQKSKNLCIHKQEWEDLIQNKTPVQIIEFCKSLKRIPYPKWKAEQQRAAEVFEKVMRNHGYREFTVSKDKKNIKARKRGTSLTFSLNVWDLRIESDARFNSGLFGSMMQHDLEAKIFNEVHNELKTGRSDSYSSSKIIEEAVKITNSLFE